MNLELNTNASTHQFFQILLQQLYISTNMPKIKIDESLCHFFIDFYEANIPLFKENFQKCLTHC